MAEDNPNEYPTQEAIDPYKNYRTSGEMSGAKDKSARVSASGWMGIAPMLMAIVALVVSAFIAQQVYFMTRDSIKASDYKLAMQASSQDIEVLQDAVRHAQEQLNESEQKYQALLAEQEQLKSTVANISGVNRVDWLVDELQHLTRLAHQRLILSHDAQGAIALLNAADQVVIEMRQPEALPIRQAIAADLFNLRIAGEIDLEGAYIRLDSLSTKIEELNFKTPAYPGSGVMVPDDVVVSDEKNSDDDTMSMIERQAGSAADNILEKLQPYLFRSFRVDADVKPILSGKERQYLERNMSLAIEQAQLALLRRESKSYMLSLEQSEKWVREYYDNSDPVTASVLTIIAELKSYRLNPELPTIDATLDSVREFAHKWQQEKMHQPQPQFRRSLSQ